MTTYVYRLFADDEVLYVGMTTNYEVRLGQHLRHSVWAHRISHSTVTEHPTRAEAAVVEADEISRLRPRWNENGRGPRAGWQLSDYAEVIMAVDSRRESEQDAARADRRVRLLGREMSRRFPGAGSSILADLNLERVAA